MNYWGSLHPAERHSLRIRSQLSKWGASLTSSIIKRSQVHFIPISLISVSDSPL